MAMALSFQAMISLVVGVACISVLTNCTDDVIVIDDVQVADPTARSKHFIQVDDYTLINEQVTRKKRLAINIREWLWIGGIIPYGISSSYSESEQRIILQSMKHWEDYTCIRFRPRTNSDVHSVMFFPGNGCYSFVGRIYQRSQGISLGPGCVDLPTVVHEIGHAIGFYHEHNRNDRDNYVRVRTNYAGSTVFNKINPAFSTTLGLGYDYASIMHYNSYFFIRNDPTIPIGGAQELSPLDVAKANRLYDCSAHPLPPPSTIIPEVTLPNGISCGRVIKVTGPGNITSPQYPSHIFNEECAFVLQATEGYELVINFTQFNLDPTRDCTEDYIQFYVGATLSSSNLIRYYGISKGRFCNRRESMFFSFDYDRIVTVYYRTNGRNIRSDVTGFKMSYNLRDIDECRSSPQCHSCKNLPGSYECNCRDGYYLSYAARTCFDVNECAFDNGGCENTCSNYGGSYSCTCKNGLFLQADGLSCGRTPPSSIPQPPTPGTIIPKLPSSTPDPPLSTPIPPVCGGLLTNSSGTFSSPNWPLTYPFNFNCTWSISLNNSNDIIEISFDSNFGLGGRMPDCPKDQLIVFDGGSNHSKRLGLFCHTTRPDPINSTSNRLTVQFVSKTFHGPSRRGFNAQYRSITVVPPTTTPPPVVTPAPTMQLPQCGGGFRKLTSLSGSLQTFNWPNSSYAINTECDWAIECPVGTVVDIRFEDSFRVAGSMPNCTKDRIIISGCEDMNYGPFCHVTPPEAFTASCNALNVIFQAGSERGTTRTGFKLNYVCTAPIIPTLSPQCGGGNKTHTDSIGSIQTLNWPEYPYPMNTECLWDISCPFGVEINFEANFRMAGRMPACDKDQLNIFGCNTNYGTYCHLTAPDQISTTCNKISVQFRSASERGLSRTGFKLNYRCFL